MRATVPSALRTDERGVATYTISDPAKRNALSLGMLQDLDESLALLADEPLVRAIVLTGAEGAFCSGVDLADLADARAVDRATVLVSSILTRIDTMPVPVIGRVNGAAFGAGLALVAAADITVAVRGARFGFPEVHYGHVAGPAAAAAVARIGEAAALDLFLTGRRFDAGEAGRLGLVSAVVDEDGLDGAVGAVVDGLLAGDPDAVARTKRLVRGLVGPTMAQRLARALG